MRAPNTPAAWYDDWLKIIRMLVADVEILSFNLGEVCCESIFADTSLFLFVFFFLIFYSFFIF